MQTNPKNILKETVVKAIPSRGKGGQHVNKTATKIELSLDILGSQFLTVEEKDILFKKLNNKISADGILRINSSEQRSQFANKTKAQQKLIEMIEKALKPRRKRKSTQPSERSKEKRLKDKKIIGEKKRTRTKPEV
ncbi:MAG: aminoacyl-tRNA hydrolase [Bacteroidia bacterium]|nr:aminoacyl-tRNA hydrolase [Bacteroidia bacterium]MCZ2276459.1 aminoacyl-tRNA hydrolase [Bacteroidia bacterium]